ncbi:MAG: TlyA family RNA methyltransferase, partial [Candidatus Aminicenantes bacterium]|nr:TlyA family RNA methyltransferase [Candidatus Aminicenantes bacterium]
LAETCQKAQALIMAGLVFGDGRRLEKAGQLVPPGLDITVQKTLPYVGRGGLKLEEALDVFKIDVAGRTCADIGSSTGGFTDCLIQRGAARVYAVDVETRQIDRRLREDPRVVLIEKNARYLASNDFPEPPDLFTIDVSFISVLKILPAIKGVMEKAQGEIATSSRSRVMARNDNKLSIMPGPRANGILRFARDDNKKQDDNEKNVIASDRRERGDHTGRLVLSLLKPQFEAGKGQVGRTGVVRDAGLRAEVLRRVLREAADIGFEARGLIRCSTRGQKGNQEFFALWSREELRPPWDTVLQWIEEVTRDENHS